MRGDDGQDVELVDMEEVHEALVYNDIHVKRFKASAVTPAKTPTYEFIFHSLMMKYANRKKLNRDTTRNVQTEQSKQNAGIHSCLRKRNRTRNIKRTTNVTQTRNPR